MTGAAPHAMQTLADSFQGWLDTHAERLAGFKDEPADFDGKLELLRGLQRELYDAGWARVGWPVSVGGKGGTVLDRAVLVDVLESNGFPPRHVFEHLEILPPALCRYAQPELIERIFQPTLRGDVIWCQGFSEPTAGSDLAALRTRAVRVDGGYRVDGHKIWTSWAKWATHCFFLARTGDPDSRHRGLSAFVVEIDAPGLTVGAIRQSNGSDELAEVFLDDVFVPEAHRVGEEGEGWAVAMHILAGERGSYTWLRQCEMLPRLEALSRVEGAARHVDRLGGSLMRLIALRSRSRDVMEILAQGREPGPESSVSKVLAIDAEQDFYDAAREVLEGGLDLGTAAQIHFWQEHYLYSRASSVYGGSREIQLNVIAKLMITRGIRTAADEGDEERETLRQNMLEAIEKSSDGRGALKGLDWWATAAQPEDSFAEGAFGAWFEAQGAAPTTSSALAGVRGAEVAAALGVSPDRLAWSVGSDNAGAHLVLGLDHGCEWLAWEDAGVLRAGRVDPARSSESTAFDQGMIRRIETKLIQDEAVEVDAAKHARALDLARIAASCEILGASRVLLAKAIDHSNEREQFGQPIAGFQAVQHLISESQIEVSTLESLCRAALEEWRAGDAHSFAMLLKAKAGQDGRSIAQRALQCFGAIGFTDEHPHHVYSRRIHTLDSILGNAASLRRTLGEELVATGEAPRCLKAWHRVDD